MTEETIHQERTIDIPSRINLNRLSVFVAVVDTGSITAAAKQLGIAKTMVSTHIRRLEDEVGAVLLQRTTRSMRLTAVGERFLASARKILAELEEAKRDIDRSTESVTGTLRITVSEEFGALVVAPIVANLIRQHRELEIDLIATDVVVDAPERKIDVAIRLGWLVDSAQKAIKIGEFGQLLVAAPDMEHWASNCRAPTDLSEREIIALSALPTPQTWTFSHPNRDAETIRFASRLSISTTATFRAAIECDGGLGVLPDYIAMPYLANGSLIRVLPEWTLPSGGIYAVFPSSPYKSPAVDAFLDRLRAWRADNRKTAFAT